MTQLCNNRKAELLQLPDHEDYDAARVSDPANIIVGKTFVVQAADPAPRLWTAAQRRRRPTRPASLHPPSRAGRTVVPRNLIRQAAIVAFGGAPAAPATKQNRIEKIATEQNYAAAVSGAAVSAVCCRPTSTLQTPRVQCRYHC